MMTLINKIDEYYKKQEIHADNFKCSYLSVCSKNIKKFTEATSSFIPDKYENSNTKLAFLSLDSGNGQPKEKRTPQGVRDMNQNMKIHTLNKNRHWYKTHKLATKILNALEEKPTDINIEESKYYFAHINCAKCSVNNKNKGQASSTMLKRCSEKYLNNELSIIKPKILITQGVESREIIFNLFKNNGLKKPNSTNKVQKIKLNDTEIIWIWFYHPTSRLKPNTKETYYAEDLKNLDNILNKVKEIKKTINK
jgi:uracil-DNA glycosylase family 4